MARVLSAFETVQSVMTRPWDWSRDWHCLGDASDVFAALWGVDPMRRLRGRYRTPMGALRIVNRAGGMDALCEAEFAACGLVCGPERAGSIGVGPSGVNAFAGRAAMICIEPGLWAGKSEGGFVMIERYQEGLSWDR